METADAFGQPAQEVDEADPFAGTDFGDFEGPEDKPTEPVSGDEATEVAAEAPPIVDREGQPVADPTPPAASAGPTDAPDPTPAASGGTTGSTTEPDLSGGHPTMTPEEAEANARRYREERGEPEPAPQAESAPQTAPAPPQEPPAPPAAAPAAPAPAAESAPQATPDPPDAPEPVEQRTTSGKTTLRKYVVMRVDEPGKFSQVSWFVDSEGKMCERTTAGAKRQGIALVRSTEDALKIGYAALGSPPEGVKLVAVAAAYFQPKTVKPTAPEPTRVRLSIG